MLRFEMPIHLLLWIEGLKFLILKGNNQIEWRFKEVAFKGYHHVNFWVIAFEDLLINRYAKRSNNIIY